ncbi:MAG: transglutaminase domain-containing protein [Planctomycetes bacterium]|nr:transglutaminase domain-containing protein [Planctomycetota bacterium]
MTAIRTAARPTASPGALPDRNLLLALQIICAASAIGALPRGQIHPLWLAAFIVPAATLTLFGRTRIGDRIHPGVRLASAAALQVAAVWTAWTYLGPLDEKWTLACSLLPAMAYFTLRRDPPDTSLSLFLSFCFLLIGIMLNRDTADWTLIVFWVACPWAMQIEASHRTCQLRHAARGRQAPRASSMLLRARIVLGLMSVAFLLFLGFGLLPSPGGSRKAAKHPARQSNGLSVGLDDRFDLRGASGTPLELTADRILRVWDPDGLPTPPSLYLRMSFFDRAGIDEWTTYRFKARTSRTDSLGRFWCQEQNPILDAPRRLVIERLIAPRKRELFVPPGVIGIFGLDRIEHQNVLGFYRTADPDESVLIHGQRIRGYAVAYQRPHLEPHISAFVQPIDTRYDARLIRLPERLRSDRLRSLAAELTAGLPRQVAPITRARRIADGLERMCTYDLHTPIGEFGDPVHDFLFGNRRGFCMHFATALAVLLRLQGVPCRIAVGFHGGSRAANGTREFGSQHAHAWVELPVQNLGWVLVDPTPSASRGVHGFNLPIQESTQDPTTTKPDAASQSWIPAGWITAILEDPLAHPRLLMALVGLLLAITLGSVVLMRRDRTGGRGAAARPSGDIVRARQLLEQILGKLARGGYPKQSRTTLEQYVRALGHDDTALDLALLDGAFRAYQEVRFGAKSLDGDRMATLAAALELSSEAAVRGRKR